MKGKRVTRAPVVIAVCLGMAMPATATQGNEASKTASRPAVEISDLALDAHGALHGVVVDINGAPQPAAKIVLVQQKREVGRAQADRLGRFRVSGLRGGVYSMHSGGQVRLVRAWTTKTAPPNAKHSALMIAGNGVIRGQMPLEDFFSSDGVVIAGLVAALIAIPIVASNQGGDSSPASP
jgi:hypothetical protein